VGDEVANLTYDRGLMAGVEVAGFDLTAMVLNGNGIGAVNSERQFEDDGFKTVAGRVTRDLVDGVRLGVFGYRGKSESEGFSNRVTIFGGDGSFTLGAFELNGQYLHREDTNPLFSGTAERVKTDAGFAEALFRPAGSRWHAFALYNLVRADQSVLNVGLGGEGSLDRYETLTGGVGYLVRRNLKVSGEMTWDTVRERMRWTLGFVTAF
jgi:hypothetical protein